jgi:hypothetical protein
MECVPDDADTGLFLQMTLLLALTPSLSPSIHDTPLRVTSHLQRPDYDTPSARDI